MKNFFQLFSKKSDSRIAATAATPFWDEAPEVLSYRVMSTDRALYRLVNRGLDIGTVIDVGASNGMWSAVCNKHYPDCCYLLIEAQEAHVEALKAYCAAHERAQYVLAVAGDEYSEVYFDDTELFGGVASKKPSAEAHKVMRQITIDTEVGSRDLSGPYMIKLDTHGYEVPILLGAKKTLKKTNLVVMETYNFQIQESSLLFYEMIAYMRELGFGVIDISEPLWREFDRAFWQIDIFFVPLDRPEFRTTTYR